jgi:DHA1 family bicyclomycin/chloramphenicol resistance-like MFS transporter
LPPSASPRAVFALLACGTVLGFAATDLVLPAVPTLPDALGGDAALGQLVLAAYVAGFAAGLLGFAAAHDRFGVRTLLVASTGAFALVSFACAAAPDLPALVALRFLQGVAAAAPAVFSPGILRRMHDEAGAIRAIGRLGSIESLVPALAPIAGAWLLVAFDWRAGFHAVGALALALCAVLAASGGTIPAPPARAPGSYRRLLVEPRFLRYAINHACVLGGLLVIVFGAPTVFVRTMGGTLGDFIAMQVVGVASFIVAASLAHRAAARFGGERMIGFGTALSTAAGAAILAAGVAGLPPAAVAGLFVPMNVGLGLAGPTCFVAALGASGGDDARGAALVVVAITGTAALGTAAAAPFILDGLAPLAAVALTVELVGLAALRIRPAGG